MNKKVEDFIPKWQLTKEEEERQEKQSEDMFSVVSDLDEFKEKLFERLTKRELTKREADSALLMNALSVTSLNRDQEMLLVCLETLRRVVIEKNLVSKKEINKIFDDVFEERVEGLSKKHDDEIPSDAGFIRDTIKRYKDGVSYDKIRSAAKEHGINDLNKIIESLKSNGWIYEIKSNVFKVI